MLKLRSIFVTSLLTGLVVTSNFGCGGGGTSTDVAIDKPTDTKTDVTPDVPKDTGGTGGATTDAKDALDAVDAIDVPKDTVDATDATDVPKDATDAGEVSDAGDAKDATDASDAEVTTPVCTSPCTIGAHQCGTGGGVQTCATNASGCAVFGAEVACGTHQACSAGVCGCVAPTDTGCTAAGAFCGSDGSLKTCALDGSCKFVSASAACAGNQTCTGTTPGSGACTCNNACALGTGVTTATICSADNSSTETCSKDTNGCNVISAVVACPGVQTCVGAACVCPAVATTPAVGLGCAGANTPNACAGDSVLECSQDQASQCYVWHVKIDCTQADSTLTPPRPAGLTCGKGTSGTGAAACQCNANATHTVFVDPVSGSDSLNTSFFPTGVSDPPACRFKSLRQGLGTAGVTTVHGVHEGANVTPVVFSFDTTFPLVVPDGVTLMSDDNTPADYIISVTSGGIGIQLGKNSMVQGFEVRTDGLTNIATSINGTGATLDTVNIVKGSSTPTTGVSISGATLNPTLNSVTVNGAAGAGIDVLASSVTITGTSSVSNSGTGIHISEGTVDATGFVANLNGTGVKVESSTTAVFKAHGGTFSNSTGVGISVATGKFFADQGATIKDNTGDGVDGTSGAQVDLSGAVVTGNAFGVFSSGNGSVTIEGGSDISSNHSDGVVGGDSTLAISGGTTINKNGGNGVKLNGATTTISGVTVDGNTFNGIDVNSPGGVSIVIGKAGSGTFLTNNTLAGLLIEKTLQTVNHTLSLSVINADISSNKGNGILVDPLAGADALYFVQDSRINLNQGIGVRVKQQTTVSVPAHITDSTFVHNEIGVNGVLAGNATGGVLFETTSTLSLFQGNNVHNNTGNQVGFLAQQTPDLTRNPQLTTQWIISGPSACTDATKNNTFTGYVPGSTGVFTNNVSTTVDATYAHWQSGPLAGVDYSSGGGITATPACP